MFNLTEQAARTAAHEDGVRIDLIDPATQQSTSAWMVVAGLDSRRARDARRDGWRHIITVRDEKSGDFTSAEIREAGRRTLAGSVISWGGFTRDGTEELPCTIDNVMAVFQQVPWVEDEVDLRVGNRANFTQG
jgi:hypothetical protein